MKESQEPNSILCDCLSYLAFSVPSCRVSFSASADLFFLLLLFHPGL